MENLSYLLSSDMLLITLRLAIPIGLAAVGAAICERSGIINLGLEGMMLMGAFGGVLGTHLTGSPWLGIVTALCIGGIMGLIHAGLCIHFRTNQTVSGVGINLLAVGLTVVLTRAVWKTDGISGQVARLSTFSVPGLSKVPLLKWLFQNQSPYLYISIAVMVIAWYILYRAKIGLRLRAIGEHPQAAAAAGIHVKKYRYFAVVICGMLCGLAGAYLSIVQNNMFVNNMVAGRGFMALAANIFGAWNPLGAFGASVVFAFTQAIRIKLSLNIPSQFVQMLPYVLTLLVLMGVGRRVKSPEALGME